MTWRIEFSPLADKNLSPLDRQIARRIPKFLKDHVPELQDPRGIGEPLEGSTPGSFWKYRVGDFRVIADIDDGVSRTLVLRTGNLREVYR